MRFHPTARQAPRRVLRWTAAALLGACLAAALPTTLLAQGREIATTAVVTFADRSGRNSPLLQAKATDAVALALSDSKEYLVTPSADVERELRALLLNPPLAIPEAVRLGRRLDVHSVTTGEILQMSADASSGRATVRLQVQMIDVNAEEPLDGAAVAVETKAIPGWQGSEADVLNEAMRQAAEQAVTRMLATRVPRGTVEAVVASGACEINLGAQQGVAPGMKLAVMRPVYIRDLEKVVLRKIGQVEISQVQADMCYATPRGVSPRTGDYVLRVYEPVTQAAKSVARTHRNNFLAVGAAVGILGALVSLGAGKNLTSPPPTPISYLSQSAMGATPVIRIQFAKPDKAHGHLLFRGEFGGFPADAPYLVDVQAPPNGEEKISIMDDQPAAVEEQERTITVGFLDESGEHSTETVDVTWTHPPLVPGQTYFHRVRRITKELLPVGSNPPVSEGTRSLAGGRRGRNLRDRLRQIATNVIDTGGDYPLISAATETMGPVTYILPVQLVAPAQGGLPQNPSKPMDFEWTRTVGADEYMLEVFPSSDPNGLGQPILRKDGVRPLGTGNVTVSVQFASGDLAPSSTFFWRAGARASLEADEQSGQGIPRVGFGSQELSGWVLSTMRSFQTTAEPPPTPAKVAKRKGGALERLGTPTARQQSARSRSRRERVTPVGPGVQEPAGGGRSGRK